MSETEGTSGYGTLLQRGDGGVGAGTKASKTFGTSNQMLKIFAKDAGTYGNSLEAGVVVSGNNTALSVVVDDDSVLINSATDAMGAATTTVLQAIAAVYAAAGFSDVFDATVGTGDGSGVIVAGAQAGLSGGTDGAEIFTTIAEVTNITGPGVKLDLIDATHMESPDSFREYLPSLLDGTEVTFDLNYLPANANQGGLRADQLSRVRRNFKIIWPDDASSTDAFSGYVTDFTPSAKIDDKLSASSTIKISGPIERLA